MHHGAGPQHGHSAVHVVVGGGHAAAFHRWRGHLVLMLSRLLPRTIHHRLKCNHPHTRPCQCHRGVRRHHIDIRRLWRHGLISRRYLRRCEHVVSVLLLLRTRLRCLDWLPVWWTAYYDLWNTNENRLHDRHITILCNRRERTRSALPDHMEQPAVWD